MAERWQGTGEAKVYLPRGVTEQHYKAQWPMEDLVALAEVVAEQFQVQPPKIQKSGRAIRRRGTYFPLQQKVVLYRLWPGVLLHELAHHVVHCLHPKARPHGPEFYAVCTEIWRVAKDLVVTEIEGNHPDWRLLTMIFGAITNSWRQQLEGHDLATLVKEAQARGARHLELRQTCLGDCETGQGDHWRPDMANLQALVDTFPNLSFDLAMAWPCLSKKSDPSGEQFQAALKGAKIVGRATPHLRIVDPIHFDSAWETPEQIPEEALAVADLAREAARQGVILSMENSGQPIRSMALLVRQARAQLSPREGMYLGLCPDPTNQLRSYPDSDPLGELAALPADMLKIVHIKQARGGKPHPTVDTGDLDCARMFRVLEAKGYRGPAIMEIPPHEMVFDNLSASFAFLHAVASGTR